MNQRERILALTALAVVILAGGGFLFKFLFLDALGAVNAQIASAQAEIDKKEGELSKEGQDRQGILRRDPRLAQWKRLSLPEDMNQEQEIKSGRPLEEVKKRHDDNVQVQYERFLTKLVMYSGFAPNTIKVSSVPVDRKGGGFLTGKTPAYTRMSFTVQGQSSLDGVVRMMEDFDKTPLLHEIRSLTLTSRAPARSVQATGLPGAFRGRQPGGFPGAQPAGFPGAQPGGFPGGRTASPAGDDLDVNITVEALLVTGAEKREALLPALLPDGAAVQAHILADPPRRYTDILAKNMFTGIAAETKMSEDPAQVLAFVKLTSIWNNGKFWQATYYDQGKGGEEKRLKPPNLDAFSVADIYGNELVKAKALQLDEDGLIFQANQKIYRWRCGEFLGPVLENPMKDDEIKMLGLAIAPVAAGN